MVGEVPGGDRRIPTRKATVKSKRLPGAVGKRQRPTSGRPAARQGAKELPRTVGKRRKTTEDGREKQYSDDITQVAGAYRQGAKRPDVI